MALTRPTALLLVGALVAAACSSDADEGIASLDDPGTTGVATTSDRQLDTEQALLEFTQCLRDQGLEVEDPEFNAAGEFRLNMELDEFMGRMSRAESREAFDACSHHLAGITQQFAGFDRTGMEDRLLAYAECVRENGYDMPDPDLSGGFDLDAEPGESEGAFGSIDTDDPAFQSANEVCQRVFVGVFDPAAGGQ